jgi:hypothetical protein
MAGNKSVDALNSLNPVYFLRRVLEAYVTIAGGYLHHGLT